MKVNVNRKGFLMKRIGKVVVLLSMMIGMGVITTVSVEASSSVSGQQELSIKGIEDITIPMGQAFDTLHGVELVSKNGKVSPDASILVSSHTVNVYEKGVVIVTYVVFDGYGNYVFNTRKVTVKAMSDAKPELMVTGQVIFKNSPFNPLAYVTAVDKEDGDISNKVKVDGKVNTSLSGMNQLTYSVRDSAGNVVNKTVIFYVM